VAPTPARRAQPAAKPVQPNEYRPGGL
jgi:hypothetical protein